MKAATRLFFNAILMYQHLLYQAGRVHHVPVHFQSKPIPNLRICLCYLSYDGTPYIVDPDDAVRVIVEGSEYLRSVGKLLPHQSMSHPKVHQTFVEYRTFETAHQLLRRHMLSSIPSGYSQMLEKIEISKLGEDRQLPHEIVHWIHDFIVPVRRIQKY